jgi:recombination protein RecT
MAKSNEELLGKIEQNSTATALQSPEDQYKNHPATSLIKRYESIVVDLLPENEFGRRMSFKRFNGLIVSTVRDTPQLMKCFNTQVGASSLVSSTLKMATLGFEPGGHLGQCWILPFKNHGVDCAQLMIGWQGYKDLCYRSGMVSLVDGHIVYERDDFEYSFGTGLNQFLRHTQYDEGDPGEAKAWWVKAIMSDSGREIFQVLHRWHVDTRHKAYSKTQGRGPWQTFYNDMALKSCFLEIRKMLPRSVQLFLRSAEESDERIGSVSLAAAQAPVDVDFESLMVDADEIDEPVEDAAPIVQPDDDIPEVAVPNGGARRTYSEYLWEHSLVGVGRQAEQLRELFLGLALGTAFDRERHNSSEALDADFTPQLMSNAAIVVDHLVNLLSTGQIPADMNTQAKITGWFTRQARDFIKENEL